MKYLGLFLILIMSSCSAQWHLKKAIQKDPLIASQKEVRRDTIIVTKERVLQDTLTAFKDTIVYRDRVRVELKWQDRKVYLSATCPSDTIVVTKTIIKTELKRVTMKDTLQNMIIWGFVLLAAYVLVTKLSNLIK
jgi:hypothetical protein